MKIQPLSMLAHPAGVYRDLLSRTKPLRRCRSVCGGSKSVRTHHKRILLHDPGCPEGINKEHGMNDARRFNEVHNTLLSKYLWNFWRGDASRMIPGNNEYFSNDGHLIPQYDFVYDINHRKKIVEHVLRFENLREDFSNLMDRYDLSIELPTKVIRASTKKELGVHNLTS